MIEPDILSVAELAARWKLTPLQIINNALSLKVPLYFQFDGLVFDLGDEWHQDGGDDWKSSRLSAINETITTNEAWIKRSAKGETGKFDHLTDDDCQKMKFRLAELKFERDKLTDLLTQRALKRSHCRYQGYIRTPPATLWSLSSTGTALLPFCAFHPLSRISIKTLSDRPGQVWDGHLLRLEPGLGCKNSLTIEDLSIPMLEVKAIEAFQKSKQPDTAPEQTHPAPTVEAVTPAPVALVEPATPAPVVITRKLETNDERGIRLLEWRNEEEKRQVYGAMNRTALREEKENPHLKNDRSRLGKLIKTAKEQTTAQKRYGVFTSHKVIDGKRQN